MEIEKEAKEEWVELSETSRPVGISPHMKVGKDHMLSDRISPRR
jgi:hypothetical protein